LPGVDAQPLAVIGRILRLAGILEQRANAALRPSGLAVWGFDVLGALRRQGEPYSLTPKELMDSTMLSSGAMTNRIDRLQELGFVRREPNAADRRSLRVTLTAAGLDVLELAIPARLGEARDALRGLTQEERSQLANLLRKLSLR